MKLFLASEAKHPDSVEKLREIVGGFEGKKIAYIPTAANGENPFGSWREDSSTWQLVQTLCAEVKAVQLEDYKNVTVLAQLQDQDILWFAGGQPGYLLYWMRRCDLDKHITKLLDRSLYVGSSAGSMITTHKVSVTEWYIGEGEHGASVIPGLGLVDFEIYPHYDEVQLPEIKKLYRGNKLYLLKNGEEIIVEDGKVQVIGETRILENNLPRRSGA